MKYRKRRASKKSSSAPKGGRKPRQSLPEKPQRVQKFLASQGLGSRRKVEQMIRDGRIVINGQTAQLGDCISQGDKLTLDGRLVKTQTHSVPRVLLYHKPVGEVCSREDNNGRPKVFDHLPRLKQGRWVSVGRLDVNTSGLLVFTTDGELANQLMHPSHDQEREYAVRVLGELTAQQKQKLLHGVMLEDGQARLERIEAAGGKGRNQWYHVIIKEGRNREVRRLFASQGLMVSRLIRVRFGTLLLPKGLSRGRYWEMPKDEVQLMKQDLQQQVTPVT